MANAFQKQLLKAGLVSKDKVNKSNKQKHKQAKQQSKNTVTEADERKQKIKQAERAKIERDRELNKNKLEQENKKAIIAQIRQLIEMNLVQGTDGDVVYNFEDGNKVKHIYVTDDIRQQIVYGRLAIVRLNENYKLVSKKVAEKIMQRDSEFVVINNESIQTCADSNVNDEYADFKVPDDLMW